MNKDKKKKNKDSIKLDEFFLKKYLNSVSPTGHEVLLGGQKVWVEEMKKYSNRVELDQYGSAMAYMGDDESSFSVVIEAHADEISWLVNHIDPDGYISVIKNGGSDTSIAPSMRVNLWGKKGVVKGIFGHPAIHIRYRNDKPNLDSIFIDVGASNKKEVEDVGIEIGTVITFRDEFEKLGKNQYMGRALDNRIGGVIISEVAKRIKEKNIKLPFELVVVNAVQEEIGLKGGKMTADKLNANMAIITDVCHDVNPPCYDSKKEGVTVGGKGGVLWTAPAVHHIVNDMIRKASDKKKIPYQLAASSTYTGTDTDAYAYSNGGCPSALISLPLKYMHTTCETVNKYDVENVIKMILNTLKSIKGTETFIYS